jgi:hypothetical protein
MGSLHAPWWGVAQVRNERKLSSRVVRAQGPSGDQVGLGQKPHAHIAGVQVEAMATIQGGQSSRQTHFLARSRTLRRQGPKRPMHGIMEHARGWCK